MKTETSKEFYVINFIRNNGPESLIYGVKNPIEEIDTLLSVYRELGSILGNVRFDLAVWDSQEQYLEQYNVTLISLSGHAAQSLLLRKIKELVIEVESTLKPCRIPDSV